MKYFSVFNTPIEFGLRATMLLAESTKPLDLQRIVILDYLLVHSGDIEGGPESLHPATPLRAGEVFIRRKMIEDGLHFFATKGIVRQIINESGIAYDLDENASIFLDALVSNYAGELQDRAIWAIKLAGLLSDQEAESLLEETIGKWKTEFVIEETGEEL